jgi:hypothetical protein
MTGRSVYVPLDTNVDSFVRRTAWDQATDSGTCANDRFLKANPAPSTAGLGRIARRPENQLYFRPWPIRNGDGCPLWSIPTPPKVELGSLNLVRQRLPDVRQMLSVNGPKRREIVPSSAQAQRAIWTTPYFVGVVIVLAAASKRLKPTTWTTECRFWLKGLRDIIELLAHVVSPVGFSRIRTIDPVLTCSSGCYVESSSRRFKSILLVAPQPKIA